MLGVFVAVGYFLFIAQYMQLVLSLSPLEAGLWSLPSAVGFIVGSNVASQIIHRFRPAYVLGFSLSLAAVGLGMLMLFSSTSGLAVLVVASLVISLALSPMFNLTTELIVGSAPPERAGAASGISETGAELGASLGISILGSIGTAVYRNALANDLPAGVPSEAAEVARDTLGGAVGVAAQLSDQIGRALLDVSRGAFVEGLHLAAAISAVIAIGAALVAIIALRNVPPGSQHQEEPGLGAADAAVAA